MNVQTQKQGTSREPGSIVIAAILAGIGITVVMFFTYVCKALCFLTDKAVAIFRRRQNRPAKVRPPKKVLPTPAIFQGMDNLAPARQLNLRKMRLK